MSIHRWSGPKRKSQKIEFFMGIIAFSPVILAVHNPSLFRMQFKPAFLHTSANRCEHKSSLLFTHAVADNIIRIPFERNRRKFLFHPLVEHIMKKKIRQQRTDHPALRRPFIPLYQAAIRQLNRPGNSIPTCGSWAIWLPDSMADYSFTGLTCRNSSQSTGIPSSRQSSPRRPPSSWLLLAESR